MQNDLDILEGKLAQLIAMTTRLRDENHQLRQELAAARNQNQQYSDRIEAASDRLEALLHDIPEEA